MSKITIGLLAICLATILTPTANAQACNFDSTGTWSVGIHEGIPFAHVTFLDCAMTPLILRVN